MRTDNDNIIYPDIISGPEVTWRDKLLSVWNRIPFWIPVATAIVIICTVFVVRNVKQISGMSNDSMFTRHLHLEEEYLLDGTYCVRSLNVDGICSTAEVICTDGGYKVTILSDYEPLTLEASFRSDGSFRCQELGTGAVSYKPSTGSIRILFTSNNTDICEFLR